MGEFRKSKQKRLKFTLTLVATLIISAVLALNLKTDRVYTHLFYVPITLSAIWIPKKTLLTGFVLASYHLFLELMIRASWTLATLSRALIIVLVSMILNEIWKRELSYQHEIKHLAYKSSHDGLTGVFNRGYFERALENTYELPLMMMVVDIDGLKSINDGFGHAAGDEHIRATAEVLRKSIRTGDLIARIGGDEFAIIAPQCGAEGALEVLLRFEEQIDHYNQNTEMERWLSLSAGYHIAIVDEDLHKVLEIADAKMYETKKSKYEVAYEIEKRSL